MFNHWRKILDYLFINSMSAEEFKDIEALKDKKILVLSFGGIPHKSVGASLILYYCYVEQLKKSNCKVTHYIFYDNDFTHHDNGNHVDDLNNYRKELGVDAIMCKLKREKLSLIKKITSSFKRIKFSMIPDKFINKILEFKPDIVVCFDIDAGGIMSKHLEKLNVPKIIWLGDLHYKINWLHLIYSIKERQKKFMFLRLPFVWFSCLNWKLAYSEILKKFDVVIASSKSAETELKKLGVKSVYLPYPWPVYKSSNLDDVKKYKIPSFLFLGLLIGLGSRSEFHFLLDKIYGKLIKLWGKNGFQILICGGHLPDWVKNNLEDKPEIKYEGYQNDLSVYVRACHALIAPIDVIVGNRSRIVTAMALDGLVIAHANTALGNPELIDKVTCLLPRTGEEFVECMKFAFEKPEETKDIIVRAKESYNRTFEPKVASYMFIDRIVDLVKSKSQS